MTENTSQSVESDDALDDDDFIKESKEQYKQARLHNGAWKKRTVKNYDFYAGRQWSDEEKTELESHGKAAVVMNRIKPRVSAVVGMEISNRQELRYQPREQQDEAMVQLFNKASEWTRDQSETEDHETDQFQDMTVCGMGWSSTMMDYSDNPDGLAVVERRTPLNYDWDPDARQANLVDMEYYFYSQDVSASQYKEMGFPMDKASKSGLGIHELWEFEKKTPHDAEAADNYPTEVPAHPGAERGAGRLKKIRLIRKEYIKRVKRWRVGMPDGSTMVIDPGKKAEFESKVRLMGYAGIQFEEYDDNQPLRSGSVQVPEGQLLVVPYVEQMEKRHWRAWFSGDNLLENEEAPCPYSFSDECMTGWRDEIEGTFFGMVDGLIDPQEWANKFLSQAIYIYTVNPKGGAYVKKGAVSNVSQFEENFSSPDAIQWMSDDANLRDDILERRPGQYPSDLDKLTAFAIDSLPALDGLTPEAMGQVSRDQPGILENMRKQASMTILAPLFNSKRRYHKRQGRTLLHYITQYFTDTQLARIVGQGIPPELIEQIRNTDVRNYDVIVDDAPSSPNAKEYNLNILMDIIRQAPNVAAALSPILIKNTPLDLETQNQVQAAIEQFSHPENTPQGQAAMKQIEQLTKENQALKSKQMIEAAKLTARVQADGEKIDQKEDEIDAKLGLERERLEQELDIKMAELKQNFALALLEMHNNLKIAKEQPTGGQNE